MFNNSGKRLVELLAHRTGGKKLPYKDVVVVSDLFFKTQNSHSYILEKSKELGVVDQQHVEKIDLSFFKILAVENDLKDQKWIQEMFKKMGIQFKIVGRGLEALEALRNEYFDLVLMDCTDSEENNLQTVGLIRHSTERFSQIPILVFFQAFLDHEVESSRLVGVSDHLLKSLSFEDFQLKIQSWVERIFESLPVLDVSSLDKIRIFDDQHQTLLRSLFQIYSENTQDELHKMRDLILDSRIELIRKKAHMLKSSAAQLGALRFEKFCILMEHEEGLDSDRAKKLHAKMCYEYENSRKKFSEYCQSLGQTSSALI